MPMRTRPVIVAILSTLLIQASSLAHNGQYYVARPVSDIVIDGQLKDWPKDMESHAISVPYINDGRPETDDFTGRFRVGYDYAQNALYVAVDVLDDEILLDEAPGPFWSSLDICEVFVVLDHSEEKVIPFQFVYRAKPIAAIADKPNQQATEAMKVERKVDGNRLIFEWRIDIGKLSGGEQRLADGAVIGFDVGYIDRDSPDNVAAYSSSEGSAKHLDSLAHADVLVAAAGEKPFRLAGKTTWKTPQATPPPTIRIRSKSNESIFVQAPVEKDGSFQFLLPAGDYSIAAVEDRTRAATRVRTVTLKANLELEQPLTLDLQGN